MLKVLAVGDPHLGRQPSYLKPGAWRRYVSDMLDAALEQAARLKVDFMVIVGDLFDNNNPHPKDNAVFTDFVFKAKEADVKVIVFPGNHDYEDAQSNALAPYEAMRGMIRVITKPTTLKMKGVAVRLVPWTPPDNPSNLGDIKTKTPHLIFHHEEAHGAKMDNGWLAEGFHPDNTHFYIGGHLHTHQRVGKRAIYVGTALPGHWNHNVKGFTLIHAHMEGKKLRVADTQVPYKPPFWLRELTLKEYQKEATKENRRVYYRLILNAGEKTPDDKRIVSIKRVGGALPANDNKEVAKKGVLAALPPPTSWLLGQLPKAKRGRAQALLASVLRNTEED